MKKLFLKVQNDLKVGAEPLIDLLYISLAINNGTWGETEYVAENDLDIKVKDYILWFERKCHFYEFIDFAIQNSDSGVIVWDGKDKDCQYAIDKLNELNKPIHEVIIKIPDIAKILYGTSN